MQLGRVAPVLVLVAGLVAGCTSDGATTKSSPAPSSAPSSSVTSSAPTSPSRSPSPSVPTTGPNVRPGEKPPTLPANARGRTAPGASDYAYFAFSALDWAYATTSTALFARTYLSSCVDCQKFANNIERAAKANRHFSGGRIAILRRHVVRDDNRHPGTMVIDSTLAADAVRVLAADGKVISKEPRITKIVYRTWLKWTGDGWRVLDLKEVVYK